MALGFGLLSAQLRPGETSWDRAYDETVRLAVEAERLGMSSVWTTEHHFVDDGYMPSLAVVSAALAAATSDIEIGTGVILAPLHHPLRLAEDAATVSLLSKGRFTLGLGLGWSGVEFEALGADMHRRGRAMEEILDLLAQAWSGSVVQLDGSVYPSPEVAVRPVPSSQIPILIGGGAEAAIRRAARSADGIFSNATEDQFVTQVGWLRDECDKVGRDFSEMRLIYYSVMLPGDDEDDAWRRYGRHAYQLMWKYSDMEVSARRPGPPPAAPDLPDEERGRFLRSRPSMAGNPDRIAERLLELRTRVAAPVEFVARSYFPTLDYGDQVELMEQLSNEVGAHL